MNQLDQLKQYTTLAADSGNLEQIAAGAPRDAALEPSLVLRAVQQPEHAALLADTVAALRRESVAAVADELLLRFGVEVLKIVPGRVGIGVDARLAFDTAASIARAHRLVERGERAGIARERLLIELAATWEGMQAARALEHEGIRCKLTLVFSLAQAVACGDAGVTLITPPVGRMHDWHQHKAAGAWDEAANAGANDPGVQCATRIYNYYKHYDITTEVMGTNFRNSGQIAALAGCDLLAIAPELLAQLQASEAPLARRLDADSARAAPLHAMSFNEAALRYALNDDAMASDLLAEGIRLAAAEAIALERLIGAAA